MEFNETQRFRPWWMWVVLVLVVLFPTAALFRHIAGDPNAAYDPPGDIATVVLAIIPFILLILFLSIRFETRINDEGVHYRLFPLHPAMRKRSWEDISQACISRSKKAKTGCGLLFNARYGRRINLTGTHELQLIFRNGKKLLLGTKKPDEMNAVLSLAREKSLLRADASL